MAAFDVEEFNVCCRINGDGHEGGGVAIPLLLLLLLTDMNRVALVCGDGGC